MSYTEDSDPRPPHTEEQDFGSEAAIAVADAGERHDLPTPFLEASPSDVFIPINQPQIGDLLGKLLTQIESMGLPERAESATKSLIRQHVQGWFGDARTNAVTSYRGCIAPIQVLRNPNGTERKYVWLAEGDHAVSVS